MVCKEDVLSWFKELESYERIDALYQLLHMCMPWELRFLGSCIEETGKHTYHELRGPAIVANDHEKLSKEAALNNGLLDNTVRHRVLLYLSLLSSRNYAVANWLYKSVLRTDRTKDVVHSAVVVRDEKLQNEFLLLFTMALHHPAFTFQQKLYFSDVLSQLIKLKEIKVSVSPKPQCIGYPPGFGNRLPGHKHAMRNQNSVEELPPPVPVPVPVVPVPVKTSLPVTFGDTPIHQQAPGLPQITPMPPQPHMEYMWSRPGFPCGPPEMSAFPAPAISPLVSRSSSPSQSRSSSPHRTVVRGSVPPPAPPPVIAPMPPPLEVVPQPPVEMIAQSSSLPVFTNELKLPDDELNCLREEKQLPEAPWLPAPPPLLPGEAKHHLNGMRYSPCCGNKPPPPQPPYLLDQMRSLNMDGDASLHHSASSSNSSPNATPPDTPLGQPEKNRSNGVPAYVSPGGPPPALVDNPPPPIPSQFSNCTVPYTVSYPLLTTAIPSRSIFYNQAYRPPFYQPGYPTTETFPTYSPYVPLIYSSPIFPPRTPNCYNCGAMGHVGPDCTGQSVEEITQKKTFTLEFQPPVLPPDAEK